MDKEDKAVLEKLMSKYRFSNLLDEMATVVCNKTYEDCYKDEYEMKRYDASKRLKLLSRAKIFRDIS